MWRISLDIQAPHFADQQILPSSLYRHHYCVLLNYYRPQRGCGKVVLLHLSVSHSVHCSEGGLYRHPLGRHPGADTPLGRLPLGRHPPRADSPLRRLLHRTVRILLECYLVTNFFLTIIFRQDLWTISRTGEDFY